MIKYQCILLANATVHMATELKSMATCASLLETAYSGSNHLIGFSPDILELILRGCTNCTI